MHRIVLEAVDCTLQNIREPNLKFFRSYIKEHAPISSKSSTIWSRNYPRELQNNIHAQLTQNLLKTSSPTYYCESKTLKFHLISHRTPYIFHRLLEILSVPLKILLILSRATFLLKTPTLTGSLRELFLLLSTKFYRETRGHITLCIR